MDRSKEVLKLRHVANELRRLQTDWTSHLATLTLDSRPRRPAEDTLAGLQNLEALVGNFNARLLKLKSLGQLKLSHALDEAILIRDMMRRPRGTEMLDSVLKDAVVGAELDAAYQLHILSQAESAVSFAFESIIDCAESLIHVETSQKFQTSLKLINYLDSMRNELADQPNRDAVYLRSSVEAFETISAVVEEEDTIAEFKKSLTGHDLMILQVCRVAAQMSVQVGRQRLIDEYFAAI